MPRLRIDCGFSLVELMAVLAIVGIIATVIVPRVFLSNDESKIAACAACKGNIELQAELWMHNTGSWPMANLSNIGGDVEYFPAGLPVCPVDGSSYTINTQTGRAVGHNH